MNEKDEWLRSARARANQKAAGGMRERAAKRVCVVECGGVIRVGANLVVRNESRSRLDSRALHRGYVRQLIITCGGQSNVI